VSMDTPELKVGTTADLCLNVEGALLWIGGGHYRQGEGESCGTAVEGAMNVTMNVTINVDLVKGGGPARPRIENDTHVMTVGSARPARERMEGRSGRYGSVVG
jgi:acetamidase/formamidase